MHAVAYAGKGTACTPVARWGGCKRSAYGAGPERPRSNHVHGADHGAITERPRSGAERPHGAARRFPTEPFRGTRAELLRAPPRGAAHGAGTEQLREAACIMPLVWM